MKYFAHYTARTVGDAVHILEKQKEKAKLNEG